MKPRKVKYKPRSRFRQILEKTFIHLVKGLGGRYRPFEMAAALKLEEVSVAIRDLPEAFDGFRIVQISDLHHGPYTDKDDLHRVVELANAQRPDLIVLTGDLVLNASEFIRDCIEALTNLRAPEGIFAVLGNHDHREGGEEIIRELTAAGIPVLRNCHTTLRRGGAELCLAGVGDLEEDRADLDQAFASVPQDRPRILLSHNPDIVEFMDGHRADLVISGHTHGGQFMFPLIGPPSLPNKYKKYREGLLQGPTTQVYVSRGVGATLLPLRYACPPEIAVIVLKKEGKEK